MRINEPFSIEYSIGKGDADIAEWHFKIHYGTRVTGGWCTTRYIYVKNYRIQPIDYAPPGALLPDNHEVIIVNFPVSVPTISYALRTTDQTLNITYQKPDNNQSITQKTKVFKLNIPTFEKDYEVGKYIGVSIPENLRQ
ncbi:hypothetical protein [Microseira wollei]|nr:hypothetical protein [Microseira wollei]